MAGPNPNTDYTCSSTFISRSNVGTSKLRATSILRPPDNTTANLQLDSLSAAGFPVTNSTPSNLQSARVLFLFLFHSPFLQMASQRCSSSNPGWRQNSFCRMPLLANSDTHC